MQRNPILTRFLKPISFFLILQTVIFWPGLLRARTGEEFANHLRNNVVRLEVSKKNKRQRSGFGFIVAESGNTLYIVTADRLVRSGKTPFAITAHFYQQSKTPVRARLLENRIRDLNLALLIVAKPVDYEWERNALAARYEPGAEVWFIGRKRTWHVPSARHTGTINARPNFFNGRLLVDIGSIRPGMLGAPLLTETGIMGMIIQDTRKFRVIHINTIQRAVAEHWGYPWQLEAAQTDLAHSDVAEDGDDETKSEESPASVTGSDIHESHIMNGHEHYIKSVAFSSRGDVVASGSDDDTVRLWDVASGRELRKLTGHITNVEAVAISPDGSMVASGSRDRTVRLWDLATGKELHKFSGHRYRATSVAFSPTGAILASGGRDDTIRLWDIKSGKELRVLTGHTNFVSAVVFSPDGTRLLSGGLDQTVRLWDTATGRLLQTFTGHTHSVDTVAFAKNGEWFASGSRDRTIRIWETASGKTLRVMQIEGMDWVYSVAFSPDNNLLASGSEDSVIRLWDVRTGVVERTLTGHERSVVSVAFSPDGAWLLSGSWDKSVRLWELKKK